MSTAVLLTAASRLANPKADPNTLQHLAQELWKSNNRGPQGTVPTTLCQLTAVSKKQTAVSHSTPEAEYIAADHAIRAEGLPLQDLLEPLFGASTLHFFEDNETCS